MQTGATVVVTYGRTIPAKFAENEYLLTNSQQRLHPRAGQARLAIVHKNLDFLFRW